MALSEYHQTPTGPVKATLDGEVTSYFEWLGAGVYHVDNRSGAMHGQRFFVQELRYGSDGQSLYLRLRLRRELKPAGHGTAHQRAVHRLADRRTRMKSARIDRRRRRGRDPSSGTFVKCASHLRAAGISVGQDLRFQVSLWQNGLPMDALPPQGWIEFSTAEPIEWMI